MKISGFQKLTLLDFPNQIACTVFTCGCNFKCPFCQNSSLVIPGCEVPVIQEDEILEFLKKRKGILDGVCITGGEPTLQNGLKNFIIKIRNLGFKVKLDTNGYNPKVLEELFKENLVDYVAMDIKNSLRKYSTTCGLEKMDLNNITESIKLIINSKIDYEFRTTMIKEFHDLADFEEIALMLKGAKKYFLQQFRDSETCIKRGLHACSKEEMQTFVDKLNENGIYTETRGIE